MLQANFPLARFTNISKDFPNSLYSNKVLLNYDFNREFYVREDFETKVPIPSQFFKYLKADERIGLGGFCGSYLTYPIENYLSQKNYDFKTIIQLPYEFEGRRRTERAMELSKELNQSKLVKLNLEEKRKHWKNLLLSNAFTKADKAMFGLIKSQL